MVYKYEKGNEVVSSLLLEEETTLPFDLIVEILCRLTVKYLLQFRCVCKSWNSLILSLKFIKKHVRHSSTQLHTLTYSKLSHKYILTSYPLDDSVFTNVAQLDYPFPSYYFDSFVGSCNGILCLIHAHRYDLFRLWNPSIRKFKELPILNKHHSHDNILMYGFGHDPVFDNYKVVVVLHARSNNNNPSSSLAVKTYAKVYTLRTNSWEVIEFPFGGIAVQQLSGKFVNGTINWLVSKMYPSKVQHCIASFDLRNESYQEVWLPNCGSVNVSILHLATLGVLRDCLCMVFCYDIWIMKEYENKESWTKLFVINFPASFGIIKVLNIFEDNQVLLRSLSWTNKLIIFNSRNGTFKSIEFGNTPEACVESLISPCS